MTTPHPEYVTDGFHIYIWHEEYEKLLNEGKLKASDPPPPKPERKLSPKEIQKLEAERRQALKDAERAVRLFKNAAPAAVDTEELFGVEPK